MNAPAVQPDLSPPEAIDTDVLVVGAGPAGLFQVFQLGLLGLRVALIDALPQAGGQCLALYPDKPIYDVPGIPVCTGRELTAQLLAQAQPFLRPPVSPACGPLWQHLVSGLSAQPTEQGPGWEVATCHAHTGQLGPTVRCKGLVLATGAGAFLPRGLGLPGLEALGNVHHLMPDTPEHVNWAGQHVVVAGGGEEALLAAAQLLQWPAHHAPARITVLHRRAVLQGPDALLTTVNAALADGRLHLHVGMPTAHAASEGRLQHLTLLQPDASHAELAADQWLVQLGLSPKLGPLAQWGIDLQRKQVQVDAATFATNLSGIHAIGDAIAYPGKLRLIVSAFHEATLAAHALARMWVPTHPAQPLYPTTNALLHERLGLSHSG